MTPADLQALATMLQPQQVTMTSMQRELTEFKQEVKSDLKDIYERLNDIDKTVARLPCNDGGGCPNRNPLRHPPSPLRPLQIPQEALEPRQPQPQSRSWAKTLADSKWMPLIIIAFMAIATILVLFVALTGRPASDLNPHPPTQGAK